jgi:hypothetical protein
VAKFLREPVGVPTDGIGSGILSTRAALDGRRGRRGGEAVGERPQFLE